MKTTYIPGFPRPIFFTTDEYVGQLSVVLRV
jgi:hypothetical protein